MLTQYYLEKYTMPSLLLTCDMDINYGGKHKHMSYKILKKNQTKALRIMNFKKPWEPSEQIYKKPKIFKLENILTISNLKFVYDQINKILPRSFEIFF